MKTNELKNVSNGQIAELLRQVAAVFEVVDDDFFRARAYENAAESVELASVSMIDLWKSGDLTELSGVGESIAKYLDELFNTGEVEHFKKVMGKVPEGMFELIRLNGVGAKTAYRLANEFKLDESGTAMTELKKKAEEGEIAKLDGFGEESEENILRSINELKVNDRILLPEAQRLADRVVNYLKKSRACKQVEVLGSLRRKSETVGDVDIAVCTGRPQEVMDHLLEYEGISKVLSTGSKTTMFIDVSGRQVDVKTQSNEQWGSMLVHYTGSKYHNIQLRTIAKEKGMSVSEHGIKNKGKLRRFADEKEFYQALGMEHIAPELRENKGEVKAALEGDLPDLVEIGQIKGDLQVHSDYDLQSSHDIGDNSVSELLKKADSLGYEYLGVTDHNPKQSGLEVDDHYRIIRQRKKVFEQEYSSYENDVKKRPIKLLTSLEVDIKPSGELAVDDKVLELLDYVLVSVHSSFRQSRSEATKRVLKALCHPKVKILGHPTGRLLQKREGLDYDWPVIFEYCVENDIWLEVNASPKRLDLSGSLARKAVGAGVKLVINTDAHDCGGLENMRYGVWTARRGWVESKDVVNTWGWKKLKNSLK